MRGGKCGGEKSVCLVLGILIILFLCSLKCNDHPAPNFRAQIFHASLPLVLTYIFPAAPLLTASIVHTWHCKYPAFRLIIPILSSQFPSAATKAFTEVSVSKNAICVSVTPHLLINICRHRPVPDHVGRQWLYAAHLYERELFKCQK